MRVLRSALIAIAMLVPGLLLGPWPAAGQNPVRIGVVDLARVLAKSTSGVAAREQLERDKSTMQREVDGRRQELEKLKDEIEKKGALMTVDARKEKQDVFERKRRDATRLVDDFQKELEKKEQGLLQKVLQDVSGIIERVGKDRKYHMIVEKRGASVVFAAPEADITDEVIRAYDQEAAAKVKK
jgi:outer membrane protein